MSRLRDLWWMAMEALCWASVLILAASIVAGVVGTVIFVGSVL